MTILEVVTRHIPTRPNMLVRNRASVAKLGLGVKQTLLVDHDQRGVAWANWQLSQFEPVGDYVWLLDDDDRAICPHIAECVREEAAQETDAVFLRMNHKASLGILPNVADWGKAPQEGRIGGSSVIVSRELWQECRGAWAAGRYESDADFVKAVYEAAERISWHDCIASECQRPQSQGAGE